MNRPVARRRRARVAGLAPGGAPGVWRSAAAAGAVLLLLLADGAAAAPVVVRVSARPRRLVAGTAFTVFDVTRNAAPYRSRRSRTSYLLARPGGRAVIIGARPVRPLRPHALSRARRRVTVPASTRPATYRLMACAGTRPFRAGACRVARRRVRILSPRPAATAAPRIAGEPVDGRSLQASRGAWRGLAPLRYAEQWLRCDAVGAGCRTIAGATGTTYALTPDDVGSSVRVAVTAANAHGHAAALARPTAVVAAAAPVNAAPPAISGTAAQGSTLTADTGRWSGTPVITYTYAWQRCGAAGDGCAPIAGATAATYAVASIDIGATVRAAVTAANAAGSAAVASAPVPVPIQNPVAGDAPDPFVLDVGGRHAEYWAFTTGDRFPLLHSTDLVHWTGAGTALAARPSWVVAAGDWHPWAPSVIELPGGGYAMYYVGLSASAGVNCVAVATAASPGGPYEDRGPLTVAGDTGTPIGCGDDAGRGTIDPSPFVDADGTPYLYVSTDFALAGGTQRLQPTISVIPLAADFLHAAGARTPLFAGDAGTWEAAGPAAPTVEGPAMVRRGATYYLLYSGGDWRGAYGMGYATATSPTGPFTKPRANPLLAQTDRVLSPGGGGLPVTGPRGATWLLYHARAGGYDQPRTLRLDRFSWAPGPGGGAPDVPVIGGPSADPLSELP